MNLNKSNYLNKYKNEINLIYIYTKNYFKYGSAVLGFHRKTLGKRKTKI